MRCSTIEYIIPQVVCQPFDPQTIIPLAFLVSLSTLEFCHLVVSMPMTRTKDFPSFASQLLLQLVQWTWDQVCTELSGLSIMRFWVLQHVATILPPRPVFLLVLDIALIEEELDQAKELVTSAGRIGYL